MLTSDFVQSDSVLNLTWLVMGLSALALVLRIEWQRSRTRSHGNHLLHIVGVAMIVAALFPYISATDDVLQIEHWYTQAEHPADSRKDPHQRDQQSRHSQSDTLIRLYEAMDSAIFVVCAHLGLILSFVAMATVVAFAVMSRRVPFSAGRSPPAFLTA